MAVLEKSTISCFLVKRGKMDVSPGFEGGLGILTGEQVKQSIRSYENAASKQ
jgi:hypothetical protein